MVQRVSGTASDNRGILFCRDFSGHQFLHFFRCQHQYPAGQHVAIVPWLNAVQVIEGCFHRWSPTMEGGRCRTRAMKHLHT